MKRRIITCFLLLALLVSCCGVFAFAADEEAIVSDTDEYASNLLNMCSYAPDGLGYHSSFDSLFNVDYFYTLDERGIEYDAKVLGFDEYFDAETCEGFLLIHFFNPHEEPIGDYFDNSNGYGIVGQGYVNGSSVIFEKIEPFNNTFFVTVIVRQSDYDSDPNAWINVDADGVRHYWIQMDLDGFSDDKYDHTFEVSVSGNDYYKTYTGMESYMTSVSDDLTQDEDFSFDNYPESTKDKSLYLIQIAESFNGDLYLYVYSPYKYNDIPLIATSVRIGIEYNGDINYRDYKLALVSTKGCITKYKVDNIYISSDSVRNYSIVSLSRRFIPAVDGTNVTNISHLSFEINQFWTVKSENGVYSYTNTEMKSALIQDKVLGRVPYLISIDGTKKYYKDSHFVAFNTDIPIDNILGIKISYCGSYYNEVSAGSAFPSLSKELIYDFEQEKWIYCDDTNSTSSSNYLFFQIGKDRVWNKIQTTTDFINNLGEDKYTIESNEDKLSDTSWVVNYSDTSRNETDYATILLKSQYAQISEMTILQIFYELNGKAYNVGCIDNFCFESPETDVIIKPPTSGDVKVNTSFIDEILAAVRKFMTDIQEAFDQAKAVIGWAFVVVAGSAIVVFVIWIVKLFIPTRAVVVSKKSSNYHRKKK